MSELVYERIKNNLETLGMKNTLTIIDNYLEQAIHEKKNVVDILDYILVEEAKSKKTRAVENQIKMSGFPYKKTLLCLILDFNQVSIGNRLWSLQQCALWKIKKTLYFWEHLESVKRI